VVIKSPLGAEAHIHLHRFAIIGEGDEIAVSTGLERGVTCLAENGSEKIVISPIFEEHFRVNFAGSEVSARIAEVSMASEIHDVGYLEGFHYRGMDLSGTNAVDAVQKGKGGRRAILILQLKLNGRWTASGYIELQMPLMMAKPRHQAFDRPFAHPSRKVEWESWRKGGQTLVNRIARIARVVVHPEHRGAGLSRALVSAAIAFTRSRWHIRGQRALFLEISAEMLKYVNFVSTCGFHYLGDTEGNRRRIAKDLISIRNGAGGGSGIMSLQRKYFGSFDAYREKTGESFESLIARLNEVLSTEDPWQAMSTDEWLALRPLIRSPIPYYMIGLDAYSDDYVRRGAYPSRPAEQKVKRPSRPDVELRDLAVTSAYEIPLSSYSRLVMEAFGINGTSLKTTLVGPIDLTAPAGTVTLVIGSSGCGKSILLSSLDPKWTSDTAVRRGTVAPGGVKAGWLEALPSDGQVFPVLAERYGPEKAFDALSRVGLSEALLYLKPFWMLSRGQRYRAMLADLMLRDDDIWLVDEFCSDLDPLTARVVAHRFKETVRTERRIAFVAAANHAHFLSALRPHNVLALATAGGSASMNWREYADGLHL
jgi:ABC-type lipoprotein export system ATPase subunit/GNAT superfamily N-acetyltransferase